MTDTQIIAIQVDGKEIQVEEGTTLLKACLDNDIYIPNLCYLEGMERPPASCRLCFVALENRKDPVPSCTIKVEEGMVIRTDTDEVRQLQRSALQFLLSVHKVDCAHCPANRNCGLQDIPKPLCSLRPMYSCLQKRRRSGLSNLCPPWPGHNHQLLWAGGGQSESMPRLPGLR